MAKPWDHYDICIHDHGDDGITLQVCRESVPEAFAQHADLVKSSDADIEQQAKFSTPLYLWHCTVHDVLVNSYCHMLPLKCRFLYGVGADLEAL